MNLTDQQKETVKKWVAEGKGVSEIQRLLSSEFGIDMMYIDVRFLIDDIGAQIPSSGENAADSAQEASPVDAEGPQSGSAGENEAQAENPGESSGGVRVTVSPIQRPGANFSKNFARRLAFNNAIFNSLPQNPCGGAFCIESI